MWWGRFSFPFVLLSVYSADAQFNEGELGIFPSLPPPPLNKVLNLDAWHFPLKIISGACLLCSSLVPRAQATGALRQPMAAWAAPAADPPP